jgi:hypothetical protein
VSRIFAPTGASISLDYGIAALEELHRHGDRFLGYSCSARQIAERHPFVPGRPQNIGADGEREASLALKIARERRRILASNAPAKAERPWTHRVRQAPALRTEDVIAEQPATRGSETIGSSSSSWLTTA